MPRNALSGFGIDTSIRDAGFLQSLLNETTIPAAAVALRSECTRYLVELTDLSRRGSDSKYREMVSISLPEALQSDKFMKWQWTSIAFLPIAWTGVVISGCSGCTTRQTISDDCAYD